VVLDEAHHAPAETFAAVVAQFPARYLLGLTATPYRRDGLDQVIGWHLGPVVAQMDERDLRDRLIKPRIVKRETGIRPWGDTFTQLVSHLTTNTARNALIVADVAAEVAKGRRCLVVSDRVEHVEDLAALLEAQGLPAAALHGQQRKKVRQHVVAQAQAGDLAVVVATCSLVGEGFDCPSLSALYLTTPVSYQARTVQYIGRVSRTAPGKADAVVYDYCDDHPMLWASWRQRSDVYRAQRLARCILPYR
jgi:superfamily II DNA or RNA helicase